MGRLCAELCEASVEGMKNVSGWSSLNWTSLTVQTRALHKDLVHLESVSEVFSIRRLDFLFNLHQLCDFHPSCCIFFLVRYVYFFVCFFLFSAYIHSKQMLRLSISLYKIIIYNNGTTVFLWHRCIFGEQLSPRVAWAVQLGKLFAGETLSMSFNGVNTTNLTRVHSRAQNSRWS